MKMEFGNKFTKRDGESRDKYTGVFPVKGVVGGRGRNEKLWEEERRVTSCGKKLKDEKGWKEKGGT